MIKNVFNVFDHEEVNAANYKLMFFQIYCAIVFAEEIFDGETFVAHPRKPNGELEIELRPPKDGPIDIHMKTYVGTPGSDLLQVTIALNSKCTCNLDTLIFTTYHHIIPFRFMN